MDRKSKVLLIIIIILTVVSVAYTSYNTLAKRYIDIIEIER
ncbi:MAG: hypothetical protein Q7R89_01100 [bacterium]|nr:hypothetical protein [bacterium]